MTGLLGTGALVRLIVRRDRVRIVVWIAAIAGLAISSAAGVKGLYPTPEALRTAAAPVEGNAAAIAFNGPVQGLATLGGRVAFETGTTTLVALGLMSLFMVGRETRAEEESGRLELVRATVVGRHAPLAAALLVVAAMNVVVGVVVTAGFIGQDLPTEGSVVFGASLIMVGIAFAGVAALTAQVTENTRVASGLAGSAVGLAFVLRAAGDIGDGTLSWLSPIGWGQKTRPYAGEQWWPLAIPAAFAGCCVALAVVLASHRDLGAGLIPPRNGPSAAGPRLGHPVGLALRLQRGALVAWALGIFLLGLVYGSVGDDIEEFVADNEALRDFLAQSGANLTDSFFGTSLLVLALIGSGFAIQSAHRLRSEETALRAEPILATPTSRGHWMSGHLAITFIGALVVLTAGGLGVGLSYGLITGDVVQISELLGAALVYAPAVFLLIGLAVALFGLAPRASTVTWAVLAVCFVVGFFGELLSVPGWVAAPFPLPPHTPCAGRRADPTSEPTPSASATSDSPASERRRPEAAAHRASEFHISPAPNSSRPQVGSGYAGDEIEQMLRRAVPTPLRSSNHDTTEFDPRTIADHDGDGGSAQPKLLHSQPGAEHPDGPAGQCAARRELVPGDDEITAESPRALDRLRNIGDDAIAPPTDLIPEEPEAAGPAGSDRAFAHDAALRSVAVRDRSHLDHEAASGDANDERRVVQVSGRSPFTGGHQRLEDAPVPPDRASAGAQGQPVQVNASHRGRRERRFVGSSCHVGSEPRAAARR